MPWSDGIVGRLAEGHEQLREAQQRTDERLRESQERTDARFRELSEQAERTEANLDALIHMFERHLREDHGSAPS